METINLSQNRRFSDVKMQKVPVFTSGHMFYDQYCLLPGQFQKVHSHAGEDKVYYVLEGIATFDIGGEVEEHPSGVAVIARAGVPHGVSNQTDVNLVLLTVMAPRP